jgi:hypothetical protein
LELPICIQAGAVQVTNMGRFLSLAALFIFISINLNAQGRAGAVAHTAAAAPAAAGAHVGPVGTGSLASSRGFSRGFSSSASGSHYVYYRGANGQLLARRSAATGAHGFTRGGTVGSGTRSGQLTSRRRNDASEFSSDSSSVPGLGFDYSHVAATHPNDFGRGRRGRERGRNEGAILFPFFDGGYFLPTDSGFVADAGEGQPGVDEVDQPDNVGPSDRPPRTLSVDRAPQLPPAPQPDVPEYVFVRRDGTVFFAVAYSWDQGSLRYVSSEGLRRTVSREALDLNATQQFNEQRGMTFRAPA